MELYKFLERFVQIPADYRPDLAHPFFYNDAIVATDGFALIRVYQLGLPCKPGSARYINHLDSLFAATPGPCGEQYDVPQCEEHRVTCSDCNGIGCEECDGTGEVIEYKKIAIGPALFNEHLLARLNGLPNCKLHIEHPQRPAWFTFTGGDGLIMPTF